MSRVLGSRGRRPLHRWRGAGINRLYFAAQRFRESEPMEDSRRIGTYLDTGANLAQFRGLFEHANIKPSASKRQRCREPANPGTDDYDSHVRAPLTSARR